MAYQHIKVPASGQKITMGSDGKLKIPDQPIIPFIEGDGTGPDIWRSSVRVLDAAVAKAYGGKRKLVWMEVFAGQKCFDAHKSWLLDETVDAFKEFLVGIKGPLTTPVGGGISSLNVALRKLLDLYVCLRPVRWFQGVPSPVKRPQDVDMVIFRENTEDIYTGLEFEQGTPDNKKFMALLKEHFPAQYAKIRFPDTAGISVKPVSREGTERLVRAAIQYAIDFKRKTLTLMHKGNIMKYTEGAFMKWGYALAKREFGAVDIDGGPWCTLPGGLIIRDYIADNCFQQMLLRPSEFDVIATMNLNGDYISDALAAEIGGIGIAPGGNINYATGHAIFEATHGTAPKYANQDRVNPGSVILSGEMMLRYMGWTEAADLIIKGMDGAIAGKRVTYDFARLMEGATEIKCSEFGTAVIEKM